MKPRVLELGESNWYGDVTVDELELEIRRLVIEPVEKDRYLMQLKTAAALGGANLLYEIARIFFGAIVQGEYSAIDPGTPSAKYQFDLNCRCRSISGSM